MSSGFKSYEAILASADAGNVVQVREDLWIRLGDSNDYLQSKYIAENASQMMMFGVNDASELREVDDGDDYTPCRCEFDCQCEDECACEPECTCEEEDS